VGAIVDGHGHELDMDQERSQFPQVVRALAAQGFAPGQGATMRLF